MGNAKAIVTILAIFTVSVFRIAVSYGVHKDKEITRRLELEVQLQKLKNEAPHKAIPPTNEQSLSDSEKIESILKAQDDLDKLNQMRGV